DAGYRRAARHAASHQDPAGPGAGHRGGDHRQRALAWQRAAGVDHRQRHRSGGTGVPADAVHGGGAAGVHLARAGRCAARRPHQGGAHRGEDDRLLPRDDGVRGRGRALPGEHHPARRGARPRHPRRADAAVRRPGGGEAGGGRVRRLRRADLRQHHPPQPGGRRGEGRDAPADLLRPDLRCGPHAHSRRGGAPGAHGAGGDQLRGHGHHRLRHEGRAVRRGRADLRGHGALRLRAAAVAGDVRGGGPVRAGVPPLRGDPAAVGRTGRGAPAGLPAPHPHADGDGVLHLQLQRHPPHHHPHGAAGVRRAARDRGVRDAAGRNHEHERHGALRGDHDPLPGAGVRGGAGAAAAAGGRGDVHHHRRGRGGGARRLHPPPGAGAGDGGCPRRRHRPDPGRGPHPGHVAHRPQRLRRPPHLPRRGPLRGLPPRPPSPRPRPHGGGTRRAPRGRRAGAATACLTQRHRDTEM
ncbi:MAG: Proton/glutamate symporter @ Sodium/glutamate symporter, partial [uncultured Gemmatimonadetes bacterium]